MSTSFITIYGLVSVLIAIVDLYLAAKSFENESALGKYLGWSCIFAAVVDVSYLISIVSEHYLLMSIMSSIYFAAIDVMLLLLIRFSVYFINGSFSSLGRRLMLAACAYAAFEVIVFAVNPFYEIAIHYVPRATEIAKYAYEMKPLYIMHLVFSYGMVAAVLYLLYIKVLRIPKEYRAQYRFVIAGILTIVFVNAVFLFWPEETVYSLLDYSICGYSLIACLLYWCCFEYAKHGMLNTLKTSIFESLGQGIVLFDYGDRLVLHNERAQELLDLSPECCAHLDDFLLRYDLPGDFDEDDEMTVQCYINLNGEERPLRCDMRKLKNSRSQTLGKLFVFSDAALETDLLTGFQDYHSFQVFVKGNPGAFPVPTGVAICDINGLSVINSTTGNQNGDREIRLLADAMRSAFPKQAYFVRGQDANLIALLAHNGEAAMSRCMAQVSESFPGSIQFAVSVTDENTPDVPEAIRVAAASMRAKKLLDHKSTHSEMLTSLIRALQECDSDTESHVRRTQLMGAELGRRIELTDSQQSNLSLLCLLHDIGKIGIPLEILNKPGKLSEEEWRILRSHTRKGYDIANSSNELRCIADAILHHHECWDGSGYPDGLSRESIPLLSRVIAVVDSFDAMTNNRSYRSALSVEDAVAELKRCAGHQFDPYIVSEFLQMLRENPPENVPPADIPTVLSLEESSLRIVSAEAPEVSNHVHIIQYSRYVLDNKMRIVDADENFEKLTGYSLDDIHSRVIIQADLIPPEERTEYLCHTNANLAKNPMLFQEHRIQRKDGSILYVFCLGRVYFDPVVRSERSEIIIADISQTYTMKMVADAEQSKAQARLRQWEDTYRRDSLTGLLSHAAFRSDVELKLLEGSGRVMMLMMDIDKFKEYNDTLGHQNGDRFLILVAQALSSALRNDDSACRMGGDEFAAALFFGADTPDEVLRSRAQQIFDNVSLTLKGASEGASVSMGMAVSTEDCTFSRLYEASDKALYRAKENGRDRLVMD